MKTKSKRSRARKARKPTGFLKLPPELRNTIYELVFSQDEPQYTEKPQSERKDIIDYHSRQVYIYDFRRPQPALTRTCRQIRNEALEMYYSMTLFFATARFDTAMSRHAWWKYKLNRLMPIDTHLEHIKRIGIGNLSLMKHLYVLISNHEIGELGPTYNRVFEEEFGDAVYAYEYPEDCGDDWFVEEVGKKTVMDLGIPQRYRNDYGDPLVDDDFRDYSLWRVNFPELEWE